MVIICTLHILLGITINNNKNNQYITLDRRESNCDIKTYDCWDNLATETSPLSVEQIFGVRPTIQILTVNQSVTLNQGH